MTEKQILKAAKQCADGLGCTYCPLEESSSCTNIFASYIKIKEEPAQAATCTDSEAVIGNDNTNSLCLNDTTKKAESQALEAAKKKLLEIYETLTPEECRAWELGEVYAEIVRGIVWGCVE